MRLSATSVLPSSGRVGEGTGRARARGKAHAAHAKGAQDAEKCCGQKHARSASGTETRTNHSFLGVSSIASRKFYHGSTPPPAVRLCAFLCRLVGRRSNRGQQARHRPPPPVHGSTAVDASTGTSWVGTDANGDGSSIGNGSIHVAATALASSLPESSRYPTLLFATSYPISPPSIYRIAAPDISPAM